MARLRPWWERAQAIDITRAARDAGCHTFVRLGGLLEIVDAETRAGVMDARFSFNSGALSRATGVAADGKRISFRREGVYTAREITDSITEWFRLGRPSDDPAERIHETWRRETGLFPSPSRVHEELASVTSIHHRRKP